MNDLTSNCSIHSSTRRLFSDRRGLSLIYGSCASSISPMGRSMRSVPTSRPGSSAGGSAMRDGTLGVAAAAPAARRRGRIAVRGRCDRAHGSGVRTTDVPAEYPSADHVRPTPRSYPRRRHDVPVRRYPSPPIDQEYMGSIPSPGSLADLHCSHRHELIAALGPGVDHLPTCRRHACAHFAGSAPWPQRSGSGQPCHCKPRHRLLHGRVGRGRGAGAGRARPWH